MGAGIDIAMHPEPESVNLSPRVVERIIHGACLDIGWEDLNDDNPERLLASFEKVEENIAYVKVLMSGELTEAWSVLWTQKRLHDEYEWIAKELGTELLWMEEVKGQKWDKKRKQRAEKTVRKLRKQAKRLAAAITDCQRFWDEYREYNKDQEAAQRLGLGRGGEA